MPSTQYLHPEFGYFAPTSRWRRDLKVAVVSIFFGAIAGASGLAVLMADRDLKTDGTATTARVEVPETQAVSEPIPTAQPAAQASRASLPSTEAAPNPTDGANTARLDTDGKSNAAKPEATDPAGRKAACDDSTWAYLDGKCVAQDKPRKRARAANDAPTIGRTPVGRSTTPPAPAASGSDDPQGAASPSGASQAKPADGAAPAEPPAPSAAPAKKPQKTARNHSRRRDQGRIEAPSWGEMREEEWSPRGYAGYGGERYGRGYGHEGRYVREGFWFW
jgi:hypothetical protein